MDIQKIIKELNKKEILDPPIIEFEKLTGGTVSHLYLLCNGDVKYVAKSNKPQVIKSEVNFLDFYKDQSLLPKLLYVDQSYQYMVYTFISGSTNYNRKDKPEMLKKLVLKLIAHYQRVPLSSGWGWADDPTDSWQSFLWNRVIEANQTLHPYLKKEDLDLVLELVKSPNRNGSSGDQPYFIHGDCGVHNFIFNNAGHLCGVIDPTPVLGDPLYDLIYAFCSSPDDLTKETLNSAAGHLVGGNVMSDNLLYEEVLIGLYLRLATCIIHHPNDLNEYLNAWTYWKHIITDKFFE